MQPRKVCWYETILISQFVGDMHIVSVKTPAIYLSSEIKSAIHNKELITNKHQGKQVKIRIQRNMKFKKQ